jgi:hypothetical protein
VLFLLAQGLDATSIGVSTVALPWLLLANGHSPVLAGLVYPLTIAPYVAFGLLAGSVGDGLPWPRVIAVSHAAQALASAIVPIAAIWGAPAVPVVLVSAFAVGSGRVFADAASFRAIAAIVGPADFVRGQSALSAVWSIGLLAGPALGGILVGAVGPADAIAAEAGALALASVVVRLVGAGADARADRAATRPELRAGLRFLVGNQARRTLTRTNFAYAFVSAGAYGLQVPLLREVVGLSSSTTGWVLAVGALVGTGAAASTAALRSRLGSANLAIAGITASAGGVGALALVSAAWEAAVAVAWYIGLSYLLSTYFIGERQSRATGELQARVGIAGRMLMLGAVSSGAAIAGALAGPLGIRDVYWIMAAATLGVAAVSAVPLRRDLS